MTTHAKYARATPAHGLSIHGKIDKLIATAQSDLDALLRTKELMTAVAKNGKVHSHESVLARAVEVDSERREEHGPRGPYKRKGGGVPGSTGGAFAKKQAKNRKATAAFLTKVGKSDKPFIPTGKDRGRVSVLIQHGYLKNEGDGYVATGKVFTP